MKFSGNLLPNVRGDWLAVWPEGIRFDNVKGFCYIVHTEWDNKVEEVIYTGVREIRCIIYSVDCSWRRT